MKGAAPADEGTATRRRRGDILFYDTLWVLCRTLGVALFGIRYRFAEPLPREGGLLVPSSHPRRLDPLTLGLVCGRRLSSLARASLFRWGPFAAVIRALDAVPIDREASTVAAMKTVIRKLRDGAALVIYPEGTRTRDGRLGEVKGGFALVARRAGVPIVPAAIVGAWECWPRTRPFPLPGRIRVEFGAVITPEEIAILDDAALVALVAGRIAALDAEARRVRGGRISPPSPRREALTAARQAGRRRGGAAGRRRETDPVEVAAIPAPAAAGNPLPAAEATEDRSPAAPVDSPPPPPA